MPAETASQRAQPAASVVAMPPPELSRIGMLGMAWPVAPCTLTTRPPPAPTGAATIVWRTTGLRAPIFGHGPWSAGSCSRARAEVRQPVGASVCETGVATETTVKSMPPSVTVVVSLSGRRSLYPMARSPSSFVCATSVASALERCSALCACEV